MGERWSVLVTVQVVGAGRLGAVDPAVPSWPTPAGQHDWWLRLRPRTATGRRLVSTRVALMLVCVRQTPQARRPARSRAGPRGAPGPIRVAPFSRAALHHLDQRLPHRRRAVPDRA